MNLPHAVVGVGGTGSVAVSMRPEKRSISRARTNCRARRGAGSARCSRSRNECERRGEAWRGEKTARKRKEGEREGG